MLRTAWLIGDEAESIMNSLTAPGGHPPAEVWIPIDSVWTGHPTRLPTFRSGWSTGIRDGEQWVDFALPGASIAQAIGPEALADPGTMTHASALGSNLRERDGLLEVKVPRYFATVCHEWFPGTSEDLGLVTKKKDVTLWSILSQVDLAWSLRTEPALIVTDSGPRQRDAERYSYFNAGGRIGCYHLEQELARLPPTTVIRCVQYLPINQEVGL